MRTHRLVLLATSSIAFAAVASQAEAGCSNARYVPPAQRPAIILPSQRAYIGPSAAELRAVYLEQQRRYEAYIEYRSAWEEEAEKLYEQATEDQARLATADATVKAGNVAVGSRLYMVLMNSRDQNQFTRTAESRLNGLHQDLLLELARVERGLSAAITAYEQAQQRSHPDADDLLHAVRQAFEQYEYLEAKYSEVRHADKEIRAAIKAARRKPACTAAINEPEATALLHVAERQLASGDACCAYQTLQDTTRLAPAPSATIAAERVKRMSEDEQLLRLVEVCQDLRWCQRAIRRAESLAEARPEKAHAILKEIVQRSPRQTEIHQTALKMLR